MNRRRLSFPQVDELGRLSQVNYACVPYYSCLCVVPSENPIRPDSREFENRRIICRDDVSSENSICAFSRRIGLNELSERADGLHAR